MFARRLPPLARRSPTLAGPSWRLGLILVGCAALAACSAEDDTGSVEGSSTSAETDSALCARFCDALPTTCPPAFDELKVDCTEACLRADGSSTSFRRCQADADTCDELRECKATH